MRVKADSWRSFFEQCGDDFLRPDQFGIESCFTVSEMYQMFKERFLEETRIVNEELTLPS